MFHIIKRFKSPQEKVWWITLNMFKDTPEMYEQSLVTPPQFRILCFIKLKKIDLN